MFRVAGIPERFRRAAAVDGGKVQSGRRWVISRPHQHPPKAQETWGGWKGDEGQRGPAGQTGSGNLLLTGSHSNYWTKERPLLSCRTVKTQSKSFVNMSSWGRTWLVKSTTTARASGRSLLSSAAAGGDFRTRWPTEETNWDRRDSRSSWWSCFR